MTGIASEDFRNRRNGVIDWNAYHRAQRAARGEECCVCHERIPSQATGGRRLCAKCQQLNDVHAGG